MLKLTSLAAATIAVTAATPALATTATPTNDPCHDSYVSGAIACQGYYTDNDFQGKAGDLTSTDVQSIIHALLNGTASTTDSSPTDNESSYNPPYALDYSHILATIPNQTNGDNTFDFSIDLSGLTVFGAHFGNNTDSRYNNVSAFWLVDVGSNPTNTITLANGTGVSNAQIFATGGTPALPEPSTWAMMLLGFGAIGVAMRRRNAGHQAIAQVA